uniref:Uncharacterized protein n=1 Tax=Arundo donax TaxID=35708 RepID=A0A0A8Y8Q3_ARUDO
MELDPVHNASGSNGIGLAAGNGKRDSSGIGCQCRIGIELLDGAAKNLVLERPSVRLWQQSNLDGRENRRGKLQ